uniref:FAM69 protein-kinase domain-containing protein n=1 Tax=Timema genevievae TaxID=629358 RepID=A0A7R9JTU5_TIMGE|nr:unnamed protein product [Timema genevievae]
MENPQKSKCRQHRNGEAVGTLCKPLCIEKQIHSLSCHAFHVGKEAVFSAEWGESKLVFKASSSANEVDPVYWFDRQNEKQYPTEAEFDSMIRDVVASKLNFTISVDQLRRLGQFGYSRAKESSTLRHTEMQNIWFLLHDNEYLNCALYSDREAFPQLLGTCGSFFAVEYVDPVRSYTRMLEISDGREEWVTQIKLAIMIMDLLDEIETNFPEPFHLCDIKMSHFGLAKGGQRLKFLDLDSVFPRTIAGRITADGSHCTKHKDCDFFDCRSHCNKVTNRCSSPVSNNNLQIVCEKIFVGWKLSGTVILPGLLMSQHTPSSLAALLRICANPNSESNTPRAAVPEDIRRRLYVTLTEMYQGLANEVFE